MKNPVLVEKLHQALGNGRVAENKNISLYFTLRTQTIAQFYFEARTQEDLIQAIKATHELVIPLTIIGGGSNMAIMQSRIEGLAVRNQYQKLEVIGETLDTIDLFVSSGYPVGRLVKETVDKGYEGFEYHLGLPGSAGGAISPPSISAVTVWGPTRPSGFSPFSCWKL